VDAAQVRDELGAAEASPRSVRPKGLIVAFGQSSGPVAPMDIAESLPLRHAARAHELLEAPSGAMQLPS
jgi:hypothetical protein